MTREEQWILDEKYGNVESEAFHADCARLQNGEPLAYIIGSIPFLNTSIALDSHPLIPRPETEFWVERAIVDIQSKKYSQGECMEVLDVCAGSGCIGIAVAKAISYAHIDFIEIDSMHKTTIEKNCLENKITNNKYTIFIGDIFETEIPLTKKYDYILSNPPYIDGEAQTVAESVTSFEPHIALFGGERGLALIERIITKAKKYLTPQGVLYIEHEPAQSDAIADLGKAQGFRVSTHTDQYDVLRYSRLCV